MNRGRDLAGRAWQELKRPQPRWVSGLVAGSGFFAADMVRLAGWVTSLAGGLVIMIVTGTVVGLIAKLLRHRRLSESGGSAPR